MPPSDPNTAAAIPREAAAFNDLLDRQARPWRLDEAFLEDCLAVLEAAPGHWGDDHLTSLARLAELALYYAGHLADAGQFQAVGDLAFNPAHKQVHVAGRTRPMAIRRHEPLSRQVLGAAADQVDAPAWLRDHTVLHVPRLALLPHLAALLESHPGGAPHARRLRAGLERLADTVVALAACAAGREHLPEPASPVHLDHADRQALEARLCRFDLARFHALGQALKTRQRQAA